MTADSATLTQADLGASGGPGRMAPTTVAWLVALVGWTTFICFYHLAGGARFEPIDCWVSQTAREMQDAGEWLVPRFSDETRMQKSPGPYWAVMIASELRGVRVDEVAARVPNALAAVGLVLTVFWLTRRMGGDRAAIFAGFATSSSVLVLWWSHRGASDLGLTTCTTLSLASLWIAAETYAPGARRNALLLLGYFAAGVGMLYKMPMPLVVVGFPVVVYLLYRAEWSVLRRSLHVLLAGILVVLGVVAGAYFMGVKGAVVGLGPAVVYVAIVGNGWLFGRRPLVHVMGLVAFLLPWLPWAIAVTRAEEAALAKWKVEFIDRFTGALPNVEGQGDWEFLAFYLPVPLLYCLPYTLSLPGALVRAFRKPTGVAVVGLRFMLIWFACLLVFFTASTGKEYRYFLPALPPLFVLLGIELAAFFDPRRPVRPRLDWLGALAVWVLTPAAMVGVAYGLHVWWRLRGQYELAGLYAWGDVIAAFGVLAVILTVGLGLAAWLYRRRQEQASFGTLVATMWLMWLWAWPSVMPIMMAQRPFVNFAEQLQRRVPLAARPALHMVGSQDPRIIWYSNIRYPRVIDQLELLEEEKERYLRGEQETLRDLEYEMQRYGEEMVRLSRQDELVLFVAPLADYIKYRVRAPELLAERGEEMPPTYLWLQTEYGREDRHFVVFGNQSPPFREPKLRLREDVQERLKERGVDLERLNVATPARDAGVDVTDGVEA